MAGPQNWRVRLDYALVLGSKLSTIRPAAPLRATFQLLVTSLERSSQTTLHDRSHSDTTDHREYNRCCITVFFLSLVTLGTLMAEEDDVSAT